MEKVEEESIVVWKAAWIVYVCYEIGTERQSWNCNYEKEMDITPAASGVALLHCRAVWQR